MPTTFVFRRPTTALALVGASLLVAACASDPLTPAFEVERRDNTLSKPVQVKVLERTQPLKATETARLTISNRAGGTLRLPGAGLTVTVPAGAIRSGTLTITVTADAGKALSYDFQPHGTVFLKALTLTQDLNKTVWKNLPTSQLWGGYVPGAVDQDKSLATITEGFTVRITGSQKGTSASAAFDIWHFSGYTLSTGRTEGDPDPLGM